MADLRTEEEQIEALKNWWDENGKATIAGVVVALGGYFGWIGWDKVQEGKIQAAADVYQQMIGLPEGSTEQASALAEQLRAELASTPYAVFAALELAKQAVAANDLDRARELLNWAKQQKLTDSAAPLIALRLAQVEYAAGNYEPALAALKSLPAGEQWDVAAAELRGDVFNAQGQADQARIQYQAALDLLKDKPSTNTAVLKSKLDNVAVVAAPAAEGDKS